MIATAGVETYALRLGDDCLILAQRLGEWSASAPELEEDVALTNIALDLLGQARPLLTYAGTLEGRGRDEDALAYMREEREFVNCQLVEQPNGDFAQTIARQLLYSTYQLALWEGTAESVDPTLAAIANRAVKEASYHRDHATQWTLRLGDGTAESHARMQRGLDVMWPYAGEIFEEDELVRDLTARGIAPSSAALRRSWDGYVASVLRDATLEQPADGWLPSGGRRGIHTEAFGYLLAEMQHLHRSHPGASW